MGKTLVGLEHIDRLRSEGLTPALVVAPLSILRPAWQADAAKFKPHLTVRILRGKTAAERAKAIRSHYDIGLLNYESFRIKSVFDAIVGRGFRVAILDESSKIKGYKSQVTKAALALAGFNLRRSPYHCETPIPRRFTLSATPAPNSPEEWWPQVAFTAGPDRMPFSPNFYAFRSEFFHRIPLGLTGQAIWRFRESMRPTFEAKMTPWVDVIRKEDALDLPDQVHQAREVTLSTKERHVYDEFERNLVLQFGDAQVLGDTALKQVMKARQLTSGFCYVDNGLARTGDSKLKELLALLDELSNEPVIVWTVFAAETEQILAALGKRAVGLYGGTEDRDESIAAFQSGRAQILVANPQSGGHGLTLTRASYTVYYSLSFSLELFLQSQDRNHRIGQERTCFYVYLVAPGTIDEVLLRTLRNKGRIADTTLAYLRQASTCHEVAYA